jgi:hypothetical protein
MYNERGYEMNKNTRNATSIDSSYIYQGALAVQSGSLNERNLYEAVSELGFAPTKRKYAAIWCADSSKRLSEVDMEVAELGIVAELKFQSSSGTVDQKGACELYNAGQTIECEHFVLVFGGSHWDSGRGQKLFNEYQQLADKFNKYPKDFCIAAKKLYVMKNDEYIEFVKEMIKNNE